MYADLFAGTAGNPAGDLAILFCRPRGGISASDRFEYEAHAAEQLNIPYHVIPIESIVNEEFAFALEHLPPGCGRRWIFRGWMLSAEEYTGLYEAMLDRGDSLVTSPAAFEAASYIPEYVPNIEDCTFPTRWIWGTDLREAWDAANELGPPPWIVKDHVKSAKDDWDEATFVPHGASRSRFEEICRNLIDARGDRFERGIVIRAFVPLDRLPHHDAERLLFDEHRLLFWEGRIAAASPYNDDADAERPDYERLFSFLGERIDAPFFAADVARTEDGRWIVVEINDGGSVTLPDLLDPRELYAEIIATAASI